MITEEDEFKRIESEIKRRAAQEPSMTDRKVMQQALECIERLNAHGWILADYEDEVYAAIAALKAALEQPVQEPVAFYHPRNGFYWAKPTSIFAPTSVDVVRLPLYTAPPAAQRPWVGLTDDDWGWVADKKGTSLDTFDQGVAWAQARLMERNK